MFDSNRKYINICTNIIYKTRRNSTNDPADASHGFDTNLMLKGICAQSTVQPRHCTPNNYKFYIN